MPFPQAYRTIYTILPPLNHWTPVGVPIVTSQSGFSSLLVGGHIASKASSRALFCLRAIIIFIFSSFFSIWLLPGHKSPKQFHKRGLSPSVMVPSVWPPLPPSLSVCHRAQEQIKYFFIYIYSRSVLSTLSLCNNVSLLSPSPSSQAKCCVVLCR